MRPGCEKLILARERGAAALLIVADPLPALEPTGSPVDLVSGAVTPSAAATLRAASRVRLRVDFTTADVDGHERDRRPPRHRPAPGGRGRRRRRALRPHRRRSAGRSIRAPTTTRPGTAVVLGLARALRGAPPAAPRTLIFVAFGAEELGLARARSHYVGAAGLCRSRAPSAMVNFDMVGRLRDGRSPRRRRGQRRRSGAASSRTPRTRPRAVAGRASGEARYAPSDHTPLLRAGVPVLFFFTGLHADYHRPGDTADEMDAAGMARVAALAARVVDELAAAAPPAYVKLDPPRPRGSVDRAGRGARLPRRRRRRPAGLGRRPPLPRRAGQRGRPGRPPGGRRPRPPRRRGAEHLRRPPGGPGTGPARATPCRSSTSATAWPGPRPPPWMQAP